MAGSQKSPGGLARLWMPSQFSEELPMNAPTYGLFGWRATHRSIWHLERSMHFYAKQKVLEKQRISCCTWPLPGIQNTKHFGSTPPSNNTVVAWGPETLHDRNDSGSSMKSHTQTMSGHETSFNMAGHMKCPVHGTILKPGLTWTLLSLKPVCLFHWPGTQ